MTVIQDISYNNKTKIGDKINDFLFTYAITVFVKLKKNKIKIM